MQVLSLKEYVDKVNLLKTRVLVILITCFLGSCAFVPEVARDQHDDQNCKMFTKSLALSIREFDVEHCDDLKDLGACLAVWGIVVPAGTFVVSGSIVLIGNTLHWLEYQGTCDDGMISKFKQEIRNI